MKVLLLTLLFFLKLAASEPWCELTSWPAVIYADEEHHLAYRLTSTEGGPVGIHWDAEQSFNLPAGGGEGLLSLPTDLGMHRGVVQLGTLQTPLAMRVVDVAEQWPIAHLHRGLPVDEAEVPVVLVDHRRGPNAHRRERLTSDTLKRPDGAAILVGDRLTALDSDAWHGLTGDMRPAFDERFPQNAVLRALAHIGQPRSIIWCPGNAALYAGTWSDEGRLCSAIVARCSALGIRPCLVVALPPLPVAGRWRSEALHRNQVLADAAITAGWRLLDLGAIAGDPAQANRVADDLYTDYPTGAAQERLRAALRDELRR